MFEYWFTWYDWQNPACSWDAIHLVNIGTAQATIVIYVSGTLKDSLTLNPEQEAYRTYQGLIGGPVKILSTQPLVASQRTIWNGGLFEILSKEQATTGQLTGMDDGQFFRG